MAKVVIKMGRNLTLAAIRRAAFTSSNGEVDQQNGVFGHQTHEHDNAND
jgi:hypothetical protein